MCLSDMVLDVFLSWSDVIAGHSDLGPNISVKKTYMEARPTTSMKKGWLCITSCDKKNHEIAPVILIQIE